SRNTVFPALDLLYYLSSECLAVSYTSRSLHRLLTPYVDNSSTFFEVSTYFRTRHEWPYGFTALVSSMSNKFKYDCYADGVYKFSFWINLPLTGCPASSTWQIDWAAGTVTRIN
ncbi:MAG: hypothetical protein M1470_10065, partial [Bacteroidetes bacterium]|nr:hypothetical protein [Bacteroidota bacterium]